MLEPHVLCLEAPGKNALSTAHMNRLLAGIDEAGGRPLLVTGAGDAFSAGLDLREVASLDRPAMRVFLELLERCVTALYLYPGPTVAAVNGHAIAGGSVITLCCDHRVMTDAPKVKFGLNEVALGVRFPPRIMAMVAARVPVQHVTQVVLGAGLFSPTDALRLGLVDELASSVEPAARARLTMLAKHPREAYALAKSDLRGTADSLCPEASHGPLLDEAAVLWTHPDVKARLTAVLQR